MEHLHHGSFENNIKEFNKPTFFFVDNPDIASTYGEFVYECSADIKNPLTLEEGTDLKQLPSGTRIAGTSKIVMDLIKKLLNGASDDIIEEAIEYYHKHGFATSPARIFQDQWNLVIQNLKRLGYDSMIMRDESALGASHGTFPAILIVEPSLIKINKIYEYDEVYGNVVNETLIESLSKFIKSYKEIDPTLVESIENAIKVIFF